MGFCFDLGVRVRGVNRDRQVIKINDNDGNKVESFKYLGSVLQKRGGFEEDMMRSFKC